MKKQKMSYVTLVVWAIRFLFRTSTRYTLGYIIAMVIQVVAEVAQLWIAAQVVSEVAQLITTKSSPEQLFILGGMSVVLLTIDKLAWSVLEYFERQLSLRGSGAIYQQFNSQLARISIAQHNDPAVRKMIDRLEYEGYAWKPINFSFALLYSSQATLRCIVSSGIIITQLPFAVLLLIIGVLPVLFVQRKSGEAGWGIWTDVSDNSRVFWNVSANLRQKDSIEEIVPQQSADYLLKRANKAIDTYVAKTVPVRRRYWLYESVAGIFEMCMAGITYIWLIGRAVSGAITFDSFVLLSSLIWQTLSSIRLVIVSIAQSMEMAPFMRDFVTFTQLQNDLPMNPRAVILGDQPLTIQFCDVSFRYPRAKHDTIQNVSFTIKPESHIALVGLNGAGKTTILRLLLRFYDPTKGTILVNGTDLRDIDLQSYYTHIGTLFQSFNRYPLEFKNNITLSDEVDTRRYQQALDISGADAVLQKIASEQTFLQPEFVDGTELSGGQWQRVAIARNIYMAGDVYILDEPTSAIDALSEQRIFDKLYEKLVGKSLITVSHRFNTVRRAETIIVLEKGHIVESGTHRELMKRQGLYYDMFTAQAEGYNDKTA